MVIDDYILDKVQPVADAIHEWTGLDCIQQARAASAVCAVFWFWELVSFQMKYHSLNIGTVICVLVAVQRAFYEDAADALARSSFSCARNPRRVLLICRIERLAFGGTAVLTLPFLAFGAHYPLFAGGMWTMAVLEACDVQTPRTGRIRESLRRMASSMQSRVLPAPSTETA